jgi:Ras-related GTP-binding protein C/D
MKYLQDLPDADIPVSDMAPQYHTGRVPNSKAGDGKPRLLLMGQRRYVTTFSVTHTDFHRLTLRYV